VNAATTTRSRRSGARRRTGWAQWIGLLPLLTVIPAHAQQPPDDEAESRAGQPVETHPAQPDPATEKTGPATAGQPQQASPDHEAADETGAAATPGRVEPTPAGVEEIVIFGQNAAQVSQDISQSSAIFTMEDLMSQGTTDLTGLSKFTPNLEIKSAFAASNPTLFIRGVGLKDYFANSSSAVAVWNDGMYMNSPSGQLFQLFDLENVDVLRGPQGTRYARNASAGAILVTAKKPTDDYEADLTMEYGNYDYYTLGGAIGVPLVDEVLSARVAFRLNQRDGITENRCAEGRYAFAPTPPAPGPNTFFCNNIATRPITGVDHWVNDMDNWAARGIIRLQPMSDMDWTLNVYGGLNRSGALQFQKLGTNPLSGFPETRDRNNYWDADLPSRLVTPTLRQPTAKSPLDGDPYAGDYNRTGHEDVDLFGSILTGTWDLGNFELKSITGYAKNKRNTQGNEDANPFVLLQIDWGNKAWQATQDFRIKWDPGNDLTLEAGVWGLYEKLDVANTFQFTQNTLLDQTIDQSDRAYAFYGIGSYYFSDHFWVEGGARYNWDKKDFKISSVLGPTPVGAGDEAKAWTGPGADLSFNYSPLDDVTLYLKYARGFKSGQFNGAAVLSSDLASIKPVNPESTDSFELGLKSYWWDQRLLMNWALFYTRYNNQQVFQLSTGRGSLPTPELINANDSVIYGMELETRFTPSEWLQVFSSFGLLESEYLDFTNQLELADPANPQGTITKTTNYSGNRLLNSPEFAWSGYVEPKLPIGRFGYLVPRFDWSFKSKVYYDPNLGQGILGDFPKGTIGQDDLWILNARLAFRTPDEKIEVAGWVRNLTNEAYIVDAFDVSQSFASLWYVIGTPRFYGLSVSYTF